MSTTGSVVYIAKTVVGLAVRRGERLATTRKRTATSASDIEVKHSRRVPASKGTNCVQGKNEEGACAYVARTRKGKGSAEAREAGCVKRAKIIGTREEKDWRSEEG